MVVGEHKTFGAIGQTDQASRSERVWLDIRIVHIQAAWRCLTPEWPVQFLDLIDQRWFYSGDADDGKFRLLNNFDDRFFKNRREILSESCRADCKKTETDEGD